VTGIYEQWGEGLKYYLNLFTRGKNVKMLNVRNAPTAAALLENLPKLLAKNPGNHCKYPSLFSQLSKETCNSFLL